MNPLIIHDFGVYMRVSQGKFLISKREKPSTTSERMKFDTSMSSKTNVSERVIAEFFPRECPHDMIIITNHSGVTTFEALRWLSKFEIGLVFLNFHGDLLSVC